MYKLLKKSLAFILVVILAFSNISVFAAKTEEKHGGIAYPTRMPPEEQKRRLKIYIEVIGEELWEKSNHMFPMNIPVEHYESYKVRLEKEIAEREKKLAEYNASKAATYSLEDGNAPYTITGAESNSSGLTVEIEAKENAPKAKIIAAFYSDSGELVKTFTKDITSSGVYDFEKPCRNYKIFIWDMQKLVPYAMPLECLYGLYEN